MGLVAILLILGIADKISSNDKIIEINGQKYTVEVADTPDKQAKGLADRDSLAENEAMLFLFEERDFRSFWMKGVSFPIDLLWIDGNLIVGWEENMQPQGDTPDNRLKKYRSIQPVDKVLELQAGSVQKLKLKMGQKINI